MFKYFNGTIIPTSFVLPLSAVFAVIFSLDLNDSECAKVLFALSL